jgi:hypothetical protein
LEYVGARGRNLRFRKPSASSVRQAPIRADRPAVQGPPTEAPFATPALVTPPAEQTLQRAVYRWSPYKRPVGALPPDKQAVLKGVGDAIIASYGPGAQPVADAKVYGRADYDTPRNPQDRAKAISDWLKSYVGGIEHVAQRGNPVTEIQLCSSADLVDWLCRKFKIPGRPLTIVGHAEGGPRYMHSRPAPLWNWDDTCREFLAASSHNRSQVEYRGRSSDFFDESGKRESD